MQLIYILPFIAFAAEALELNPGGALVPEEPREVAEAQELYQLAAEEADQEEGSELFDILEEQEEAEIERQGLAARRRRCRHCHPRGWCCMFYPPCYTYPACSPFRRRG
jgi:hypothetical protein